MAETYRVRVRPKEYKMIKNLAEEKDITFAEAVERLIEGNNIIMGDKVVDQEEGDNNIVKAMMLAAGGYMMYKLFNNQGDDENI